MIRDQWMRDSMLDMGNPAAGHGFMVHIFINGLYWGVHNLCERQDASHYAAYNGGDEDLLDARNGGQYDRRRRDRLERDDRRSSPAATGRKIQQVLDIDNYIDYQIINRYGGNADLKSQRQLARGRRRPVPAGQPEQMAPWQLYSWDGERILEGQTATTSPLDPMGIAQHPGGQRRIPDPLRRPPAEALLQRRRPHARRRQGALDEIRRRPRPRHHRRVRPLGRPPWHALHPRQPVAHRTGPPL